MTFPVNLERPACPVCASTTATHVLDGRDRLHGLPGQFSVQRCRECDLLYTSPRPDAATLPHYYPDDYEPHAGGVPRTPDARRFKDRVRLAALVGRFGYPAEAVGLAGTSEVGGFTRFVARFLRRPPFRLPVFRGQGRVLDVGCGDGGYLVRLRQMGWTVQGLDLSPTAVRRARSQGLEVFEGRLEDLPDRGQRFDLIRLASVLEHVPEPVATLARAGELLSPEGRVVLVLPNAASLTFRLFGSRWFPLDLPRHLQHFTPRTLREAVRRAGLMVSELRHDSGPRGLTRSLAYCYPGRESLARGRLTRRLLSPVAALADLLGAGDSMEVTLQRPAG